MNGHGFTVFPSVDIVDGRSARSLQGRFGTETVYSDDPVKVALGFCAAGARWLHIVDLDGALSGVAANREIVLEVVRLSSCPVQAGGGVRTREDVEEVLAAGASRAVVGTTALDDPDALASACARYGERMVVSLEARGDHTTPGSWTVGSGVPVLDAVDAFRRAGVAGFIYTDVGRDGTMGGPNLEGLSLVAGATDLPVVASGGISSLDDLRSVARLRAAGVGGAIVGRALYENKFGIGEANFAADEAASGAPETPLVEG